MWQWPKRKRDRVAVARYDINGNLKAIHMDVDEDWVSRFEAARSGFKPPEGGHYAVIQTGEKK